MQLVRKIKRKPSTERRRKVLALCGDSQVGLWMLRSLAQNGLTVYAVCKSSEGQAAHSRYCSGAWALDQGDDAATPAEQVVRLAKELEVGSVMPISEAFHASLIQIRDQLEPEIHLFSPSAESFEKATDKEYLHNLCLELGVPVAKGMRLDKLIASGHDTLKFPLVLRTCRQNSDEGQAPWKAAYARDAAELQRLCDEVRDCPQNVIVQEYHSGVEDHVHMLMHRGDLFMVGEYIGEYHSPLAGGVTVQRVSCYHERVVKDAVRLLQTLGWDGVATCQFHYDIETDEYIFLEINPRMCGGQPTVIMAGFHSPFLLWQSHFEPEKMRKTGYRKGLRTRILGGSANWMLAMIRGDELPPDQQRLSTFGTLMRFLWNSGPWTKDDSFSIRDPKPFFIDLKQMFIKRIMKRRDYRPIDLS
ncbi:carboxylate--amine ligase [Stieleria mannarensis]|uniref:carboxylate--amine ligase n=1 Tax=Stieleria mannarensis TaxID=2755585 RepID=UPI001602D017|nr:ATP-grasp domain-containing protein [Rhodopirellula sp. JC639]